MNWRNWFSLTLVKEIISKPWIRKTAFLLLCFFLLFSLVLFSAGPPLLKSYLTSSLSEKLGRKISVGTVHINPLMLSISIDHFTLAERDGKTPFVTFKQAYVNAQFVSIFFGGPVLGDIRLTEPYVNLVRIADNTYNFQDMVDRLKAASDKPKKEASEPLRFSLNNIRILSGRIIFDDRPKGRQHNIHDLNVAIPFLSNLSYRVDDYVLPEFSAVINGSPFRLTGKSKPFEADRESSLNLKLSKLNLGEYLTYVPKKLFFTLPGGTLDMDLSIAFLQSPGKAPSLKLSGSAGLNDLALDEAKQVPTIRLKHLEVVLGSIEPLVKRFTIDRAVLDGLELFVRQDRLGRLNLTSLVEPDKEKKPMPFFLLREGNLNASVIHVRDDSRTRPLEATFKDIRILVHNLTSEKGKAGQIELTASGPAGSSLKAAAEVALEPFAVSGLNAQIADLHLPLPRQGAKTGEMIAIGRFDISGAAFQPDRRNISIDGISLQKSRLSIQRNRKGDLNLSEIVGSSHVKPEATPPGPAWQYALKKLSLDDIDVRWRDEMPLAGAADIELENISATVENVSSLMNSEGKVSVKAQLGRSGKVGVDGSFITKPQVSAKLQIAANGLPILPVQPYFADKVQIRTTGGTVSARGVLSLQLAEQAKISYQGEASVNQFVSVDKVNDNDFLKWETLRFSGVQIDTAPLNVAVREISLRNFYSRLIINPDGSINVQHVLSKGEKSREAAAGEVEAPPSQNSSAEAAQREAGQPTRKPASPLASDATAKPTPIRIGRVLLQDGHVRFSDRFIKPNYSANLTQLDGRITGLSSDLATTADVMIRGTVDGTAPVFIQGKINPLTGNLFLDLAASAKAVDLPTATPYSARYAGYPITKGKLSMDVKYSIENRKLQAENRIVLDQLTFGEKVESPKATKLPVLLAVALLKDRRGVIDVNLPISGSLDDPKFSVGGIIVKVIINLITKAVTAPFALLGNLVGGGEELSFIEFEPGRADLNKTALDKISSLAKALEDRPGLKLDITGRIDPATDSEGLRTRMLERKMKALKLKRLAEKTDSPSRLENIRIDPGEYPKLLKQVYSQEKIPKPRNAIGLAKDLPVAEMEKLLLTHTAISDDDLRQLGIRRARVVSDAIVKSGKVAAERVFILEPKLKSEIVEKGPAEKAKLSRVDFSLK